MKTNEFKFYCPRCDQPMKCEVQFADREIQCPGCEGIVRIPKAPSGSGYTQVEPKSARAWDTNAWGG